MATINRSQTSSTMQPATTVDKTKTDVQADAPPSLSTQPEFYTPTGEVYTRGLKEPDENGAYPFASQIAEVEAALRAKAQRDHDHQLQLDWEAQQAQQMRDIITASHQAFAKLQAKRASNL